MIELLQLLIIISEKAANIARICRPDQPLFQLLVEKKNTEEANSRFAEDFKTLADVLIQETVRYDISKQFPELAKYIEGEESNTFTNTLGKKITITIQSDETETANLLKNVLDDNLDVANVLAAEVHKNVLLKDVNLENTLIPSNVDLITTDKLAVWIDPIDATAEYISGKEVEGPDGVYLKGLRCVTVLIGVYNRESGVPIIGVVNQTFNELVDNKWRGKCYWGLVHDSLPPPITTSPISHKIALSKIELVEIKTRLKESGYTLIEAAGAGYKLLTVITGLADVYIVSQPTTYRWDVCGPHAILKSFGGGVYDYKQMVLGDLKEINYDISDSNESKSDKYRNEGGLIATKNIDVLLKIQKLLQEMH